MSRVFPPIAIKMHAKRMMRGRFRVCAGATIIPALIVTAVFAMLLFIPQVREAIELITTGSFESEEAQMEFMMKVFSALVYGLYLITAFFNFLSIGGTKVCLDVVRGKEAKLRNIFLFYDKWYVALIMPLITTAISIGADEVTIRLGETGLNGFVAEVLLFHLQLLLFFISLKTAFVPCALADNGCKSFWQALKTSWRMTNFKTMVSLFLLYISFIGWYFLIGLTMGLVSIYVIPYFEVSAATLYEAVRQNMSAECRAQDAE